MLIDYIYCGESVVPEDRLNVILHLMSLLGFTPPVYTIRKSMLYFFIFSICLIYFYF